MGDLLDRHPPTEEQHAGVLVKAIGGESSEKLGDILLAGCNDITTTLLLAVDVSCFLFEACY